MKHYIFLLPPLLQVGISKVVEQICGARELFLYRFVSGLGKPSNLKKLSILYTINTSVPPKTFLWSGHLNALICVAIKDLPIPFTLKVKRPEKIKT